MNPPGSCSNMCSPTGMHIHNHCARATAKLAALFGIMGIAFAPLGKAAVVVFDNMSNYENGVSGAAIASTSSTPNYFMGDGYQLTPGTTRHSHSTTYCRK